MVLKCKEVKIQTKNLLRNDDKISSTILLVLFHFSFVVKVFKYYGIRRFCAL
jgi:hypothetical protein